MGGNYPDDVVGPEDQRLSSLRSSLISPNAGYLAQQQQSQQHWQQDDHAPSWNTADTSFGFNTQYPHYQQQQQWMVGQYAQPDEQGFMPQQAYWGGYDPQGQQMLASSGPGAMVIDQTNSDLQSNSNQMKIDGHMRKDNHGENESAQVKTPPVLTDHQLQMKRAAAIASLQKRATSAGASGPDNTPSRGASGTPPQTTAKEAVKAKEGKPNGTQRSLFQAGDNVKGQRESMPAYNSPPVEGTAGSQPGQPSSTAGKTGLDSLKTPSKKSFRYQKQDDSEAKGTMYAKASSIDIDGLLAEGRAAAEASQKTEIATNASPKPSNHRKGGVGKKPGVDQGPTPRRSSLASAVSSDPSELGEIRDEPEKQRMTSQSKPEGTTEGTIAASEKDPGSATRKTLSSNPTNGLSKNPTTKTNTFIDDKQSKQDTNQPGYHEKRRSGTEYATPKNPTVRQNSFQSSQARDEKRSVPKPEPRSAEKSKKPQDLHSRPERVVYEPARDHSRYKTYDQPCKKKASDNVATSGQHSYSKTADTRNPGDSRKPAVEDVKPSSDNGFAHLDPAEVEEIKEWLAISGYYDEIYRRKTIQRQKRLAALEQEKAELLKEEQEERGALTTTRTHSFVSSDGPVMPGTPDLSSLEAMPPPKLVHKNDKASRTSNAPDDGMGATDSVTDGSPTGDDPHASRAAPLKRRLSVTAGHDNDPKPFEKVARTGYDADAPDNQGNSQERYRESPGSRRLRDSRERQEDDRVRLIKENRAMDGMSEERREALNSRRSPGSRSPNEGGRENDRESRYSHEPNKMRRGWSESSEFRDHAPFPGRGRGRGRFHRGAQRGAAFFKPHRSDHKGSASDLDLHLGNVEYFLVKSWTYENVEISQREGTWATQAKNIEKLSNAFENCRHVILVFSVNNSKAFQGYARMESRPGAPGIRTPSWAEELVWEPSPPFKIRWITINETRFRYVGHLKNSFNEDSPVLVGRDGQEIEPQCGQSLCEIITDEDPNKQANHSWVKPHKPMSYKTW